MNVRRLRSEAFDRRVWPLRFGSVDADQAHSLVVTVDRDIDRVAVDDMLDDGVRLA